MPDDAHIAAHAAHRTPTSHERATGLPWDASYHDGPAPWDIGRPQPSFQQLLADPAFSGPILDVGCGTGENALYFAASGFDVVGIDVATTAIQTAAQKAESRGLRVEFLVADALRLDRLARQFRTVTDCGLFHTFDRDERARYAASLATVTAAGATVYILCFSDQGAVQGPHPISRHDLIAAFDGSDLTVSHIAPASIYTRFHADGLAAWLATVTRRTGSDSPLA